MSQPPARARIRMVRSWRWETALPVAHVDRVGLRDGRGEFRINLDVLWQDAEHWVTSRHGVRVPSPRFWAAVEREAIRLFAAIDAHERLHIFMMQDRTMKVPSRWVEGLHHRIIRKMGIH